MHVNTFARKFVSDFYSYNSFQILLLHIIVLFPCKGISKCVWDGVSRLVGGKGEKIKHLLKIYYMLFYLLYVMLSRTGRF